MKRRARRVTIVSAALGTAVVVSAGIAHWKAVRDHVEAWQFQLTRETKTIEPEDGALDPIEERLLHRVASFSRRPVIFAPGEMPPPVRGSTLYMGGVLGLLEGRGWRVLEQRFPRQAYVLVRDVTEPWPVHEREAPARLRGGGADIIELQARPIPPRSPSR